MLLQCIIKHTGCRPRPLGKRAQERLRQGIEDEERKREIIGIANKDDEAAKRKEAWDDHVARDLGIHFTKLVWKSMRNGSVKASRPIRKTLGI